MSAHSASFGHPILVFHVSPAFGNSVAAVRDLTGLTRICEALRPLTERYRVALIFDPALRDRHAVERCLDRCAAWDLPFVLDLCTSDSHMLAARTVHTQFHDAAHGITLPLDEMMRLRGRYGALFAGMRIHEAFAQDFTVHAIRTTNPEWAHEGLPMPDGPFFRPDLLEPYLAWAQQAGLFVHWSDWHWHAFAGWDEAQREREHALRRLLRRYPGVIHVTYANNEPNSASAERLMTWHKAVDWTVSAGAAGFGLSNQSWMHNDTDCPIEEIVAWTMRARRLRCSLIQFEPPWYLFHLPRGTFAFQDYRGDPAWTHRGQSLARFRTLTQALMG